MLGRLITLALVLGVCGVALAAPSPSHRRGGDCGAAKGHTLASSTEARVYSFRRTVYGCAGRRQFRLGGRGYPVSPVVVVGRLAAYGKYEGGYDFVFAYVVVRNLADGTQLFHHRAVNDEPRAEPSEWVGSLVAARDGHVAWIGVSRGIGGPPQKIAEVHSDRTVLDSGSTIGQDSLRLHGSLLSWKHGSQTRTARLR
jgi:hypothetical protein